MYMIQNGLWLDDKLSGVAPLPPRQRPPIQPPSKEPFDVLHWYFVCWFSHRFDCFYALRWKII